MEKIKKFVKSRAGFAITINLITLIVAVVLFRPFWEEGDDVAIALLAEGAYGAHEPHLLYSNIIYGHILCVLQKILPFLRWHAVLMYLFLFGASSSFCYILCKDKRGRVLSIMYLMSAFFELYVLLQFSKVSAAVAILSYIALFKLSEDGIPERARKILAATAYLCLFYSMILRDDSFLLATMIAGLYGISRVVYECAKKEFTGKVKTYIRLFVPVFAVFALCVIADDATYKSGPWGQYKQFYDANMRLTDYHNSALLYDIHGEELDRLGVSENDALMLITYQTADKKFLTPQLMDEISALDHKHVDIDLMKAWVANIYNDIFVLSAVIVLLVALAGIGIAYVSGYEKKLMIFVNAALQVVATLGVLFYYQYSGRWSHRIVYALLLGQLILLVYLLSDVWTQNTGKPEVFEILVLLAFCVVSSRLGNEFAYRADQREAFTYDELIKGMEENKDKLFVGDVFTMIDYGKHDIFKPALVGQFDNYLMTDSSIISDSPVNDAIAAKFGHTDPFEALMAKDERVFLVDSISPEVELTYCNEHGGGTYELKEMGSAGNIAIYAIN